MALAPFRGEWKIRSMSWAAKQSAIKKAVASFINVSSSMIKTCQAIVTLTSLVTFSSANIVFTSAMTYSDCLFFLVLDIW
jgi:hypothetical protein